MNAAGHVVWTNTNDTPHEIWFHDGTSAKKLNITPTNISPGAVRLAKNADVVAYFSGDAYRYDVATDTEVNVTVLHGHASSRSANITNDGLVLFNDNAAPKPLYISDGNTVALVATDNRGDQSNYHPVSEPSNVGFTYSNSSDNGSTYSLYYHSGGMGGTGTMIPGTNFAGGWPQVYQYSDDGTTLLLDGIGDIRMVKVADGTILKTINKGGNETVPAISPGGKIAFATQGAPLWYSPDPTAATPTVIQLSTLGVVEVGAPQISDELIMWTEAPSGSYPWPNSNLYAQAINPVTGALGGKMLLSSAVSLYSGAGTVGTNQTQRDGVVGAYGVWSDDNGDVYRVQTVVTCPH